MGNLCDGRLFRPAACEHLRLAAIEREVEVGHGRDIAGIVGNDEVAGGELDRVKRGAAIAWLRIGESGLGQTHQAAGTECRAPHQHAPTCVHCDFLP